MTPTHFRQRLRNRRRFLNLTQQQLADKLHITRGAVCWSERTTDDITLSKLIEWADALNLQLNLTQKAPTL